jgi:hypothetical protein
MILASVSDYLERHQARYTLLSHPTAYGEAETGDVTREPYGFPPSSPTPPTSAERIANAEHEAERAGMPGLEIPESPTEVEERARRPEPSPRPERG